MSLERHAVALQERVLALQAREAPKCMPVGAGVVRCTACGFRGVPAATGCPVCVEAPVTDLMFDLEWAEFLVTRLPYRRPPVHQRVIGERVGRNDPCPCGSGAKYKRCHGG